MNRAHTTPAPPTGPTAGARVRTAGAVLGPGVNPVGIPFNFLEELTHRADRPDKPMTMHSESWFSGSLDPDRLRRAIATALAAHPMARARKGSGRSLLRAPRWDVSAAEPEGVLHCVTVADDSEIDGLREPFYNRRVDLTEGPAVRFLLARRAGGDVLMLAMNHAVADGVGAMRFLHSVARAYAGRPDPPTAVDALAARDLRALHRDFPGRRPARVVSREDAAVIAPEGASGADGYGFAFRLVGPADRQRLRPRSYGPPFTLNDLLLAALHRAVASWNAGRGQDAGLVSVFVPMSLRPEPWYNDVVANLTLGGKVVSTAAERGANATLMAAVADQVAALKAGGGLARLLRLRPWASGLLPVVLPALARLSRRGTWNSAVLTYFGQIDREVPDFGPEPGSILRIWGSPPVGMPTGLAVGVALYRGSLHLAFRYRRALFGPESAGAFADEFLDHLFELGAGPAGTAAHAPADGPAAQPQACEAQLS